MKTIGMLTTVIVGAGLVFGVVIGVRSIPDFQRYLRMRSM